MKNERRIDVLVRYKFDLGSDALPIDVQAKAKGLTFKDVEKAKKIVQYADYLTMNDVFSLSVVSQVWTRISKILSDMSMPIKEEV